MSDAVPYWYHIKIAGYMFIFQKHGQAVTTKKKRKKERSLTRIIHLT